MKNDFENIKNYSLLIPFLGGYMILYGAINVITYYNQFNVNIVPYINFSEIITYFIKDIDIVIINLILFGITLYVVERVQSKWNKSTYVFDNQLSALKSIVHSIEEPISGDEKMKNFVKPNCYYLN